MKKKLKVKRIYKTILLAIIIVYVCYIFISQQKTLNSYSNREDYYLTQISEQEENKKRLISLKDNINSEEYIEQMAREKLDMYLPNERVYIDIGK